MIDLVIREWVGQAFDRSLSYFGTPRTRRPHATEHVCTRSTHDDHSATASP